MSFYMSRLCLLVSGLPRHFVFFFEASSRVRKPCGHLVKIYKEIYNVDNRRNVTGSSTSKSDFSGKSGKKITISVYVLGGVRRIHLFRFKLVHSCCSLIKTDVDNLLFKIALIYLVPAIAIDSLSRDSCTLSCTWVNVILVIMASIIFSPFDGYGFFLCS